MLNLKQKQNQKLEYIGLQRYHLCNTWKCIINYALFMVLIVYIVLIVHSTQISKNKTYYENQT